MKTIIITLVSLLSLQGISQTKGIISKKEQQVFWKGKAATGGYSPEGTLGIFSAEILVDQKMVTSLYITIDMRTLYHENKQLKNHLRDKDFFDVKKYPVATFLLKEETSIEKTTILVGEMTIKGIAREEKIPVNITQDEACIHISFEHTIDRTQYGVTFNSPSIFTAMKENLIADNFTLKGSLSFKK